MAVNLRSAIQKGTWKHFLPPERSLCKNMKISRPVLRKVLHVIANEGWITITPGHSTSIRSSRRNPMHKNRKVVLLYHQSIGNESRIGVLLMEEIRKILAENGYLFEMMMDLRLARARPESALQALVQQHEADYWILASLPLAVQNWFQNAGLSAVVLGNVLPHIHLPSVDYDFQALIRHAVGEFIRLGHRRIAYFLRESSARTAGGLIFEEGFRQACQAYPKVIHHVVMHSGERRELCSSLRNLLRSQKPSAILVSHMLDSLSALTYLLASGFHVPGDISLISQQADIPLERTFPSVSRYYSDPLKLARYLCRLLQNPSFKNGKIRLIPSWIQGETVGPAR
ncbi:MAG: substrate-binding domain-containing protein [Kiritimatiellae bacterium]|nr:substrate-binding domain-containing protein [Kiritimatiellia bacterium]MDD5519247.1 substrate-binding domain-containing protein [Kiritimatiellia bacterium]